MPNVRWIGAPARQAARTFLIPLGRGRGKRFALRFVLRDSRSVMGKLTMAACLVICTGAIAAEDPPAARDAQAAWLQCRTEQASALDDGISDARSIGVAVAQA